MMAGMTVPPSSPRVRPCLRTEAAMARVCGWLLVPALEAAAAKRKAEVAAKASTPALKPAASTATASTPSSPLKAAAAAKAAAATKAASATKGPIPHATPRKARAAAVKAFPPTPTRKAAEAQASTHKKAASLIAEQPQPRKQQQRAASRPTWRLGGRCA